MGKAVKKNYFKRVAKSLECQWKRSARNHWWCQLKAGCKYLGKTVNTDLYLIRRRWGDWGVGLQHGVFGWAEQGSCSCSQETEKEQEPEEVRSLEQELLWLLWLLPKKPEEARGASLGFFGSLWLLSEEPKRFSFKEQEPISSKRFLVASGTYL